MIWNLAGEEAFKELRTKLCSKPILSYPQFKENPGQFILDVAASGATVGAVLSQVQAEKEKVIAYGSYSFNKSQRNYGATQRELLTIFIFLEIYGHHLLPKKYFAY